LSPKIGGYDEGVDLILPPPGPFVTASMKFPVVQSTERDSELVADLTSHRTLFGKLNVVSISNARIKKPSRPASRAYLFRKIAAETVVVQIEDRKTSMTSWEALLRMVQNRSLNGDKSAAQLLSQIVKNFPGTAGSPEKRIHIITEEDKEL
jgi:hypothetical protein